MTLEDHAGDVVGKARKGLGVSPGQIAKAGGFTAESYGRFEEDGTFDELPDFEKIGELLHLDAHKLATIATGWRPRAADLDANKTVRQITTNEGMEVHCYLVWDDATREAALFDTGWSAAPILALLQENELTLKRLFITHTHHDHVAALTPIRKQFPDLALHSSSPNAPEGQRNQPGRVVELGSLQITSRETPGHAKSGNCLRIGVSAATWSWWVWVMKSRFRVSSFSCSNARIGAALQPVSNNAASRVASSHTR
jgi:hypothetical protein